MSNKIVYKEGDKRGIFTVLKDLGYEKGGRRLLLQCPVCPNQFECNTSNAMRKNKLSCGCLNAKGVTMKNVTHGQTRFYGQIPEYKIWNTMRNRCINPKVERYPLYGGRGISVCERWMDSFENFLADMGNRPSSSHSIERRNSNGNYEPDNCYWATILEQANNTSRNLYLDYKGRNQTLAQWCRELKLPYATIRSRIKYLGQTVEQAFEASIITKKRKRKFVSNFISHSFGHVN